MNMPRECSLSNHLDRADLEALAVEGIGVRELERRVAEKYEQEELRLSRSALDRHLSRECQCWKPESGAGGSLSLAQFLALTPEQRASSKR
jgi:hypothetical protein